MIEASGRAKYHPSPARSHDRTARVVADGVTRLIGDLLTMDFFVEGMSAKSPNDRKDPKQLRAGVLGAAAVTGEAGRDSGQILSPG